MDRPITQRPITQRPIARNVWLNGDLVPSDGVHLSVFDRGVQLGDGVFEAFRALRGVATELAGHLARLHSSADAMAIPVPFSDVEIHEGIRALLAAESLGASGDDGQAPGDAEIRLVVSRGFDPRRSVLPAREVAPTVVMQAWPHTPPPEGTLRDGERMITSSIPRDPDSPMSRIKTISRADLVFARLEAQRAGADDAIFLTRDGRVTEATTSNVLVVRGDECITPRLSCGILAGTTRAWLVEHGASAGLRMREDDVRFDELFAADELAVCASIGGVLPVTSLDGRAIGDGRPGPRTMALREARENWIDATSRVAAARR